MRYCNKQINVLLNNFVRFLSFFFTCKNFEGAVLGLRQLLATEKPFKNDEKCFSFHLKSSFRSQDIIILTFWSCIQNVLIKMIRLISNFMTSQPTIVIHILPNISTSKHNQTMKFDQSIECNMRNIFFEKSYTKYGGEISPRPFSKNFKLSISLDQ